MEGSIKSPSMLWDGFATSTELNESVIKEYTIDNILYREVYFSGSELCDGVTRIYGVFACPKDIRLQEAILHFHEAGKTINTDDLHRIACSGYAVFAVDYSGENENSLRHTIYPKSLDYANYIRSGEHLTKAVSGAEDTCWYQWTVVGKYALAFLKKQKEINPNRICVMGVKSGGYFAYLLAAFSDIACAVSIFDCGWTEYAGKNKYSDDNNIIVDEEREHWLAGVAAQCYAHHVKVPFLYLGGTNDTLGNIDRMGDTLSKIKAENYFAVAPRLSGNISVELQKTMFMFLDKYLACVNVNIPNQPTLSLEIVDGKVYVDMDTQGEEVEYQNIYIAFDNESPRLRNWILQEGREIDCMEGQKKLFVIGEVKYKNGAYLSTAQSYLYLGDKDVLFYPAYSSKMIYNSTMGVDSFTAIKQTDDIVLKADYVQLKKGAFDIFGVCATDGTLATYKISEPLFKGDPHGILKFDAYASVCGELRVRVQYESRYYTVKKELLGGELWQKIELSAHELKNKDGLQLPDWSKAVLVSFDSGLEVCINNMLWL